MGVANHLFYFAALYNHFRNAAYRDLTRRLPYTFLNGNQRMLVVYHYTTKTIRI